MALPTFDYVRPLDLAAARDAYAEARDARYLAGGQTLIPVLKQRLAQPAAVIDLNGISDLEGINVAGGEVTIGAMTCHAEVAASSEVRAQIPALAHLAGMIGDPQVRNRGTLGGSLANNDPSADYPAAVLGLGATVHTDRRGISADDFFDGLFTTALQDGEIITRLSFPIPGKFGYAKFAQPASLFALVGVAVAQTGSSARVAVTGAGSSGVFRQTAMEGALGKGWSAQSLAGIATDAGKMMSDIHGDSAYRAHLVGVMAKRALAQAG